MTAPKRGYALHFLIIAVGLALGAHHPVVAYVCAGLLGLDAFCLRLLDGRWA